MMDIKIESQCIQGKGKKIYNIEEKYKNSHLIGFQARQRNASLPRKAKGRYLQVTFQLQSTKGY